MNKLQKDKVDSLWNLSLFLWDVSSNTQKTPLVLNLDLNNKDCPVLEKWKSTQAHNLIISPWIKIKEVGLHDITKSCDFKIIANYWNDQIIYDNFLFYCTLYCLSWEILPTICGIWNLGHGYLCQMWTQSMNNPYWSKRIHYWHAKYESITFVSNTYCFENGHSGFTLSTLILRWYFFQP